MSTNATTGGAIAKANEYHRTNQGQATGSEAAKTRTRFQWANLEKNRETLRSQLASVDDSVERARLLNEFAALEKAAEDGTFTPVAFKTWSQDVAKLYAAHLEQRKNPTSAPKSKTRAKSEIESDLKAVADPAGSDKYKARLEEKRKAVNDYLGKDDMGRADTALEALRKDVAEVEKLVKADEERARKKSDYENRLAPLALRLDPVRKATPSAPELRRLRGEALKAESDARAAVTKTEPDYDTAVSKHLPDLDQALTRFTQAQTRLDQEDAEFQVAWKQLLTKYREAREVESDTLTAAAIGKLDAAHKKCFDACRAFDFKQAKGHLQELDTAATEVIQAKNLKTPEEDTYWDDYLDMKGACKYQQTKEIAAQLEKSVGKALGSTPTGRLAKQFLDQEAVRWKWYSARAWKAATDSLPALQRAVDAAAGPLEQFKDGLALCSSAWENLQTDYETAKTTPSAGGTVSEHIRTMEATYAQARQKLDALDFSDQTHTLIQTLAAQIQTVKNDKTTLDQAKSQYDAEYKKIVFWFDYGQDFLKDLKTNPPGLLEVIAAAERAFLPVEASLRTYNYTEAIGKLQGPYKTEVDRIFGILTKGKVFEGRKDCDEEFERQVPNDDHQKVKARADDPELMNLVKNRDKVLAAYKEKYKAGEYAEAKKLIPAVAEAVNKLTTAAATRATEGGQKSDAARDKVNQFAADGLLAMRPQDEKVQLVRDLLRSNKELTGDSQKALFELWKTIDLDEQFQAADQKRRNDSVTSLVKNPQDKKDFKQARDDWAKPTMDVKTKGDRLIQAHKAQCAALGIKSIPLLVQKMDPGDLGGFSPGKNVIEVNSESSSFKSNFAKVMDTIFHETMHWYQANLVERLNKGEIQEGDPEYQQALLFALNDGDAYYSSKQSNDEVYRKQPQEKHAYDAGPDMAKLLEEALNK